MKKILLAVLAATTTLALTACDKTEQVTVDFNEVSNELKADLTGVQEFSYANASTAEKEKIMGELEKYAVENFLTGLTLYENGRYVLYSDTLVKGSENYIQGYGNGTLTEGEIIDDIKGQENTNWKRYYHSYVTETPGTFNYFNSNTSIITSLGSHSAGSLWETKMNAEKDGTELAYVLANSGLTAELDANGQATKFKVEVKAGTQLKYSTNSTKMTEYNNQEVNIEDYVTVYKEFFNKSNGMLQAATNLTNIKGINEYYNATEKGFNQEAWDNVGIKTITDGDAYYLEFEFVEATTIQNAMTALNSYLYAPIPSEFLNDIGGIKNYGTWTQSGFTPIDTMLSTGAYMFEFIDEGKEIVYQKNSNYAEDDINRYKIAGLYYGVLTSTDTYAAWNEFQNGKLHSVIVPPAKLNDCFDKATYEPGFQTFKLNMNTTTQEEWNSLFGEEGTLSQTQKTDYWQVEPAMSNDDFLFGLHHAFDRQEYADATGYGATASYLPSSYLIDSENGVYYNDTKTHKDAISKLVNENTDEFGYSSTLAKAYFKKAAEDMIESGDYNSGDEISLEILWMTQGEANTDGAVLKAAFEEAFNNCGSTLTLKINNNVVDWSEIYSTRIYVGQFDMAYGAAPPWYTTDPLAIMERMKSDNSSGFTMNFGPDTSINYDTISYDGKTWSYDALWKAATSKAYVKDGVSYDAFHLVLNESKNLDGLRNIELSYDAVLASNQTLKVTGVEVKGTKNNEEEILNEFTFNNSNKMISFNISESDSNYFSGNVTITVTYEITTTVDGVETITTSTQKIVTKFVK